MDKCGWVMVLVLMVLKVLLPLVVEVPVKVMAASDGACQCDGPTSIRASQGRLNQLGCRVLP